MSVPLLIERKGYTYMKLEVLKIRVGIHLRHFRHFMGHRIKYLTDNNAYLPTITI